LQELQYVKRLGPTVLAILSFTRSTLNSLIGVHPSAAY